MLRPVRSGVAQLVPTTRAELAVSYGLVPSWLARLMRPWGRPLLPVVAAKPVDREKAGGPTRGVSEPALANPRGIFCRAGR